MKESLEKLASLHGPSGYEDEVRAYIKKEAEGLADVVKVDGIGNLIAEYRGDEAGPVLVVTAHMDEIGLMIKKIEPNGLLKIEQLGGHDARILPNQPVEIKTDDRKLTGVIGHISAHYKKFESSARDADLRDLYVDAGASSFEEAEAMGLEPGQTLVYYPQFHEIGAGASRKIAGKAFDDRAGCAVLLELLKTLRQEERKVNVTFLFTVQEEIGLRGAQIASRHVTADGVLAVDTTAAGDTPEAVNDGVIKLGAGAGIKALDFSLVVQPAVKNHLKVLAKERNIPYQIEVFAGIGTDGGALYASQTGVKTGVLSIPSRYTHSAMEIIDLDDLEAVYQLMLAYIETFNPEEDNE